jgi:hypothetical protein
MMQREQGSSMCWAGKVMGGYSLSFLLVGLVGFVNCP